MIPSPFPFSAAHSSLSQNAQPLCFLSVLALKNPQAPLLDVNVLMVVDVNWCAVSLDE